MEGQLYVPQKMLPASMLQELQDNAILLCDGISLSLKFRWAVSLSQSISRYRPAERSGSVSAARCLQPVVIEARATSRQGREQLSSTRFASLEIENTVVMRRVANVTRPSPGNNRHSHIQ